MAQGIVLGQAEPVAPPWKTLQSQSLQVCCTQLCESPTAHPKGPWELSPPDYFPFVYGHGHFFNLSPLKGDSRGAAASVFLG